MDRLVAVEFLLVVELQRAGGAFVNVGNAVLGSEVEFQNQKAEWNRLPLT